MTGSKNKSAFKQWTEGKAEWFKVYANVLETPLREQFEVKKEENKKTKV